MLPSYTEVENLGTSDVEVAKTSAPTATDYHANRLAQQGRAVKFICTLAIVQFLVAVSILVFKYQARHCNNLGATYLYNLMVASSTFLVTAAAVSWSETPYLGAVSANWVC
jgi:hypothetical protein